MEWRRPRRVGWSNDPHLYHLPELLLGDLKLLAKKTTCPGKDGRSRGGNGVEETVFGRRRVVDGGGGSDRRKRSEEVLDSDKRQRVSTLGAAKAAVEIGRAGLNDEAGL